MLFENACIEGLGYHLPENRITSSELETRLTPLYERLKLPSGRLQLMSGIKERRFWDEEVFPSEVAAIAGKKAIENSDIDANDIAGLIPLTGHAITHFTVRDEMGISGTQPIIDKFAPLYHVRKDAPPILLITGNRELEMLGRYEENAYLMRMLKVVGHPDVELMELDGYGHGIGYPSMPILLNKIKDITKRIK